MTDWAAEVLFRVFNVRPEEVPKPMLRSRFLDAAVCQVVPNGGEDYRQCKERARVDRE